MHHQEFSGDSPGTGSRKTSFHYRRGSSGASAAGGGGGANAMDDIPTQAGSSSPGLHHQQHPAQSQVSGAQVKKKSGFQITSVTSAQINVSGNNSLADDTESYDDMDESHTEDLSSSEMLDVSVSRATDTGLPERSSSDETLNSLHGVDTPGIVSPNEPIHPHSIPQGSQQHASLVNGTVHQYFSQQHSQPHHHHSDSLGGGEPPLPALPVAPLASSSPAMVSKTGTIQSQKPPGLDKAAGGAIQPSANVVGTAADLQGGVNISNVSAVPAAPPSGPPGFDNASVSGQVTPAGTGQPAAAAPSTQPQHTQTQTATGSRFRVVKLDTNSEPFRKGRWTCTEFYEKEVPPATTSEVPKVAEVAVETETSNTGITPGAAAVQPPHTLQSYQPPSQDFTSPQAMQSPPQALAQTTPLTYVSPQEVVGGAHMQKPVAPVTLPPVTPQVIAQAGVNQPLPVMPQQLPYAGQPQGGYPAPQLHAGVVAQGSVRQPDFIQPTAPFQTQVQPPLSHVTTGISIPPGPGVAVQPPVSITQQIPLQGQVVPPALGTFPPQTLPAQPQAQPPSTAPAPGPPTHATPYMPLTSLQADLQPILTPGATLSQGVGVSSLKSSHLEDAQKLLFQHQGLLGLPKLGSTEVGGAVSSLAHMGMSVEASAFMAVAAAGLRTQHGEGDEDR